MQRSLLPLVPFLLAGCKPDDSGAPDEAVEDSWSGMIQRAVILVHDGVRIEESFGDEASSGGGWSDAHDGPSEDLLPMMRERLLPEGTAAIPGYVTGYTVTSPAHLTMLTGRREHYEQLNAGGGTESLFRPRAPTLFELLRARQGLDAEQAVLTGNASLLEGLDWSLHPGLGEDVGGTFALTTGQDGDAVGTDQPVALAARDWLRDDARLVVANMHQVDLTGHQAPDDYAEAVQALDQPTVGLWDWIQSDASGIADETLLVVLADHGRHRRDSSETPWQHHGCSCAGCREVPMLLLGPGIRRGATFSEPQLLEDITQTVAWLMGLDVPLGTGMLMTEALEDGGEQAPRSGPVLPAASGDLRAWQQWRDDRSHRSEIVLDEQVVDDDALHVEKPQVLRATRDWACWRRLELTPGQEAWDWELACRVDEGHGWEEFEPPGIKALYDTDLVLQETPTGALLLAMTSLDDAVELRQVKLTRWSTERGWEEPGAGEGPEDSAYQSHPALAMAEQGFYVAYGGCRSAATCRRTRNVYLQHVRWPAGKTQRWQPVATLSRVDSTGRTWTRVEDPALLADGATLHLAAVGFNEEGSTVLAASMDTASGSWTSTRAIDSTLRTHGHVRPVFGADDHLYWSRLDNDDLVEICRVAAGDSEVECRATDAGWIEGLAAGDGKAWVSLSDGDQQWELVELRW